MQSFQKPFESMSAIVEPNLHVDILNSFPIAFFLPFLRKWTRKMKNYQKINMNC